MVKRSNVPIDSDVYEPSDICEHHKPDNAVLQNFHKTKSIVYSVPFTPLTTQSRSRGSRRRKSRTFNNPKIEYKVKKYGKSAQKAARTTNYFRGKKHGSPQNNRATNRTTNTLHKYPIVHSRKKTAR